MKEVYQNYPAAFNFTDFKHFIQKYLAAILSF